MRLVPSPSEGLTLKIWYQIELNYVHEFGEVHFYREAL